MSPRLAGFSFSLIFLALLAPLAGCSGGGGGGSSDEALTSMSQLKGTYKVTSVETAEARSARSYDAESLEIHTFIDPPYYANYGKGGVCFNVSSIVSETVTDDGLYVEFQTELLADGVPPCGEYLLSSLGITAWTAPGAASPIPYQQTNDPPHGWTFSKEETGYHSGYGALEVFGFLLFHDTPDIYPDSGAASQMEVFRAFLASFDGDSAPAPSVTTKCEGYTHGDGVSYIKVCFELSNMPSEGLQFTFSIGPNKNNPGGIGGETQTHIVRGDGTICFTYTISEYGRYYWELNVADLGGNYIDSESGSVNVEPGKEQECG
ncbi:MAG: hypothetical protein ACNS63_01165 [Candidatus Nitrospinota bacterium M3_3B_026]